MIFSSDIITKKVPFYEDLQKVKDTQSFAFCILVDYQVVMRLEIGFLKDRKSSHVSTFCVILRRTIKPKYHEKINSNFIKHDVANLIDFDIKC